MATIIVGVDDSPRSEDAIALAGALAASSGAEIVAVCAFPYDDRPEAHFNPTMRPYLEELASKTLDRLCQPLNDDAHVRRVAVADLSAAHALDQAAREHEADLLVVGSSHTGHISRLHPGATGEHLLHGAPCPVAVAPRGYRLRPRHGMERISVAYDGSVESGRALRAATLVARAVGAQLRVIRVFASELPVSPATFAVPGFARSLPLAENEAREELRRAVESVPADIWAEGAFLHGDAARELEVESQVCDLLVIGSRGYGPLKAVVLGAVSGHVARTASCPLLIVPRGADAPLAALYGALRETTDTDGGSARTGDRSVRVPLPS